MPRGLRTRVASALLVNATQVDASTSIAGDIAVLVMQRQTGTNHSMECTDRLPTAVMGLWRNTSNGWGVFGESLSRWSPRRQPQQCFGIAGSIRPPMAREFMAAPWWAFESDEMRSRQNLWRLSRRWLSLVKWYRDVLQFHVAGAAVPLRPAALRLIRQESATTSSTSVSRWMTVFFRSPGPAPSILWYPPSARLYRSALRQRLTSKPRWKSLPSTSTIFNISTPRFTVVYNGARLEQQIERALNEMGWRLRHTRFEGSLVRGVADHCFREAMSPALFILNGNLLRQPRNGAGFSVPPYLTLSPPS